jgi:hypothetical protein
VGISFNLNAAIDRYLDDLELAGKPVKVKDHAAVHPTKQWLRKC